MQCMDGWTDRWMDGQKHLSTNDLEDRERKKKTNKKREIMKNGKPLIEDLARLEVTLRKVTCTQSATVYKSLDR